MPILVGPSSSTTPQLGDQPTRIYVGDSGIVIDGDPDEFGCLWKGGDDSRGPKPGPREVTGDRDWRHGQYDGTRFYGPRNRTIEGTCRAPDHLTLHRARQRLNDAVGVELTRYRLTEPGFDLYAMMRQTNEILWTEVTHRRGYAEATWSISLYAPDPYYRTTATQEYELGFPSSAGGLVLPMVLPVLVDATVVSGTTSIFNPGRVPAPVRIHVTGPADDVTVAVAGDDAPGQALTIGNPDGATLGPGDWLDVDTDTHRVLLNDTGSRRSWASGDWLLVPPGVSDLLVGSSSAGADAGVVVEFEGLYL